MNDRDLSRDELIRELEQMRARLADLEAASRPALGAEVPQDLFRTLAEESPNMIFLSCRGRIVYANSRCEEVTGYTREAFYASQFQFLTLIAPEYHDIVSRSYQAHLEGRDVPPYEYQLVTRDGRRVDVIITTRLVDYAGDRAILGIVTDISVQKQAERALKESEERYRQLVEISPDIVALAGMPEGGHSRILYINPTGLRVLGSGDHDEVVGRSHRELVHPDDLGLVDGLIQDLSEGKTVTYKEMRLRAADGTAVAVEVAAVPLLHQGQPAIQITARDLSERKRIEGELVKLERLRALGEMSAGVSHNLNNLLTGILGPAQLLIMRAEDPGVVRDAGAIERSALRAMDLVQSLHLSTRAVEGEELGPVQVGPAVDEAVVATRPRWHDETEAQGVTISVHTRLDSTSPVRASAPRLHTILANLILNAVDAMPLGGQVDIASREADLAVELSVSDTGVGMPEETRRRVLEPFFTTKMDVGSGLGLSTAYGAITRWGGTIDVQSAVNEGTTVRISLPVWRDSATGPDPATERAGRILIADDDPIVSDVLVKLLSESHEVEAVTDGPEAPKRFREGGFDVAVIDLGMPGIPGHEVLRRMHATDPSIASILITGWQLEAGDPRLALFDFHVQKPFESLVDIQQLVAEAIELRDRRTAGKSAAQSG